MKTNKMKKEQANIIRSSAAEYLTYVAAAGENGVELRYEDENIWLTQKMLASLYNVNIATINEHIKNIYKDNELDDDSTIRNFLIVQKEGNREVSRNITHYKCTECNKLFEDSTALIETSKENVILPIDENEHKLGEWIVIKEATEDEKGEEERVCQYNSEHKEKREIDLLQHTCKDFIKVEKKEATCLEAGNKEHYKCSTCEKVFADESATQEIEDVVISAKGHDWNEWIIIKEATETETGIKRRTCKNDDSHVEEQEINCLLHVHDLQKYNKVEATCKENGIQEYWKCTKCLKLYNDEGAQQEINEPQIIEKLKHSWDKGVITEEATCEKDGTKTFTCEICNETRIETIEKTGHNWGEYVEVKKATVDSEGLKIRTCKNNSQHTQSGVLEKLPLQIVYGEYTNYTSDSNEDITIKANGTFSKFIELRIDGVKVDSKNYTIKEGSTIVTLNQEYLNTLSSGKHTITFVYNDNRKIDAIINIAKREQQNEDIKENNKNENDKKEDNTVQENEDNNLKNENTSLSPQTGDNITNYIAWFLISALGILVSTRFLKKK